MSAEYRADDVTNPLNDAHFPVAAAPQLDIVLRQDLPSQLIVNNCKFGASRTQRLSLRAESLSQRLKDVNPFTFWRASWLLESLDFGPDQPAQQLNVNNNDIFTRYATFMRVSKAIASKRRRLAQLRLRQ